MRAMLTAVSGSSSVEDIDISTISNSLVAERA